MVRGRVEHSLYIYINLQELRTSWNSLLSGGASHHHQQLFKKIKFTNPLENKSTMKMNIIQKNIQAKQEDHHIASKHS